MSEGGGPVRFTQVRRTRGVFRSPHTASLFVFSTMTMLNRVALVLSLLLFAVGGASGAFCQPPLTLTRAPGTSPQYVATLHNSVATISPRLDLAKKKEPEKRKTASVPELILLYLTPWKNPNSIFLYMFLILIVLGNISENRHVMNQ